MVTGVADFTAHVIGNMSDFSAYQITFDGEGRDVTINGRPAGTVALTGRTQNKQLDIKLTTGVLGAPQEVVGLLKNYGARIGTAYQIYDDCLDIAGTESETGKTLGTDLRKGKLTLPVLTLLESASAFDRERCCALVLEGRLEEVAALLQSAPADGAFGAALDTAAELIRGAQSELAPLVTNRCVDSLFGLGEALLELLEQLRS